MIWYIGCSGFHYTHWKPQFYPKKLPQRLWFEYYNKRFNTLELNTTFYNFPKAKLLQNWYEKSPDDYKFTVKATRIITHYNKFVNVKALMEDFYDVTDKGLKEKLGCILFQLPPNLHYSEEKLEQIIEHINPRFVNVIEFRHKTWWKKNVYDLLEKNNIIFCSINHPTLPRDIIINTQTVYCRMHGASQLYVSEYKLSTIKNLYEKIKSSNVKKAFVYFNNDINTAAIKNGMQLQKFADVLPKIKNEKLVLFNE
jgi:uncharacterized protein YecE (DUF72 family)